MTTTANRATAREKWTPNPAGRRVLPILPEEIETFEEEVQRFRDGEWDNTEFTRFRLRQGIYGQRQPDSQMIRIKVPFGGLTADQMDVMGQISDRFAPLKKGHLTTRENVQFHHVPLPETPEVLRALGDVGLTTREACGNTVRNVVAPPEAGVASDEVFDVTPYAGAYARYFLRHATTQNMPRKVKTAFSGSENDVSITAIHDVGFIARVRDGQRGFKMVVGGGLSIMPRMADTLYEFVPVDEFLKVSEACLRIFNRSTDERKSLMKARIKFLIAREGIEEFRRLVELELEGEWAKKSVDLDALLFVDEEETDAPGPAASCTPEPADDDSYDLWKRENTSPQRQTGFNLVYVRVERGDIYAEQWSPLGDIARGFAGGRARIDQQQNLIFRWVRDEALYDVYLKLRDLDMAAAGRETIRDIVTCPGTDSCKLGITSSMGLNKALGAVIDKLDTDDQLIRKIHIKASGCPNSCGQHHIADIGFHGAVMKGKGGQVPAYELFLGGKYGDGDVRVGQRVKARVPARFAPRALTSVLDYYRENRNADEPFASFVQRVGTAPFEQMFRPYKEEVGPLDRENIDSYMDWGKTVLYKLERGEGECAV